MDNPHNDSTDSIELKTKTKQNKAKKTTTNNNNNNKKIYSYP